jgi:uncharacterized protein (DUF58 family)
VKRSRPVAALPARRSPLRLTRRGIAVVGGGAAVATAAFVTGYGELTVLALVAVVAVLLALAVPRLASPMTFRREGTPRLVSRGSTVDIALSADARRAAAPITVVDHLAGQPVDIALPATDPGLQTLARYRIQPLRRGVQQLGPLLELRSDPFNLAVRTITHQLVEELVVHPVVHPLRHPDALRQRSTWVMLSAAIDDPAADVRSLREYTAGDDQRLVHWPSVAKTGTLMVRDIADRRRLSRTVLLETLDHASTEALFEDAVEIAASIACEALRRDVTVVARTRDRQATGRPTSIRHRNEVLELLARVRRTSADATVPVAQLMAGEPTDDLVLVAGAASPAIEQLASLGQVARRLTIVRLVDHSTTPMPLPVRSFDVTSAEQFTSLWCSGDLVL